VREARGSGVETSTGALIGLRLLAIMPSIPLHGMERANLEIMRLVRERGAHVLFVTEATWGQRVQAAVEARGCEWTTVSLLRSYEERLHLTARPLEMAGVARAWMRAAHRLLDICGDYRPTHIYVTNLTFFLYAVPAILRSRVPVIFRVPNPPESEERGFKPAVRAALWRLTVALSDVVVCNSHYSLKRLATRGLAPGRVRVIYPCLPQRPRLDCSDAYSVSAGRFTVLYLGRIRPEKGVDKLVDAARRIIPEFPDVDFLLVGDHAWRNDFAVRLRRQIVTAGLDERVRILDEIEDVPGLLKRCQLHVMPSIREPFGIVVLEAKSQGVPSVVFPTGGMLETVTHLVDGYVCRERSAEALVEGIRFFLEDDVARRTMGAAACQSLERYSPDVIADQWSDVFLTTAR
jgi:glycosyltransferase involved in cell wall biosynthesis